MKVLKVINLGLIEFVGVDTTCDMGFPVPTVFSLCRAPVLSTNDAHVTLNELSRKLWSLLWRVFVDIGQQCRGSLLRQELWGRHEWMVDKR